MKSLNKFSHIGLFSFGVSQDGVRVMVFSAIFNKISVLLLEEILSLNVISCTPCHHSGLKLTTLMVMGTDCTDSCKSNYHTITATMAP